MAKKKPVVIIDEELTPTVLAVKRDNKKSSVFSILWLIVIFAIFIAGVIYLPEISSYVNSYLNPEVNTPVNKPSVKPKEEEEEKKEEKEYKLSDNPEITLYNFKINNIQIENGTISFDIINTGKEMLDFSKYNYFIQLYGSHKSLLERIMIKDLIIGIDGTENFSFNIKNSNIESISLVNIGVNEYPNYSLEESENGAATLKCTKDFETINYLFNMGKLYAIQDIMDISKNNSEYNNFYSNYMALSTTYNNIAGVASAVNESTDSLRFTTTINLSEYKEKTLSIKNIYNKDTEAKVIKFELEASGYTCK